MLFYGLRLALILGLLVVALPAAAVEVSALYKVRGQFLRDLGPQDVDDFYHHLGIYLDLYTADRLHLEARLDVMNDLNYPYGTFGRPLSGDTYGADSEQVLRLHSLVCRVNGKSKSFEAGALS